MGRSSSTTIVALGIVAVLFMAIMSTFYLQQIPTQADLDRLGEDIRREHGLFLASVAPIDVTLHIPQTEEERTGVSVVLTLRPDLRKKASTIELYLDRIGESVLRHPDWKGRLGYVTVVHAPPLKHSRTIHATGKS